MKSKDQSAFEKVASNLDALQYIFQFLDLGDQLRFANVNEQLKFVFRDFISRRANYKNIKIKKYSDTIRLRTNDNNLLDYDFSYEEYEYFLNVFGPQVEALSESHGSALNISIHLQNVTSINYSYLLITKQQIQLLAILCPHLENLFFNGCCNKKHEILRFGLDIELNSFVALKNLKTFSLKTGLDYKIKYGFMENLTTKKSKLPINIKSRVETLTIYMSSLDLRFLELFDQLTTLSITVFSTVNNEEIIALSQSCPKLKELTFHYTTFENIENFSNLQTLSDLSFYHCEGLTYENLKEILTALLLVTFTSISTKYAGLFHYYFLAPTIKSIYIDAIQSFDFKTEMEFYRSQERSAIKTC